MLPLVPRGPEAQLGAAPREDVEGGDGLGEQPGVTVGHPAHQEPETQPLRLGRGERQRGVALEHRLLGRPQHLHLEPVVHHRQRPHPDRLGRLGQRREGRADGLGAARPGEARHMDIELHVVLRLAGGEGSAPLGPWSSVRFGRERYCRPGMSLVLDALRHAAGHEGQGALPLRRLPAPDPGRARRQFPPGRCVAEGLAGRAGHAGRPAHRDPRLPGRVLRRAPVRA